MDARPWTDEGAGRVKALTDRQTQVLGLLARGLTYTEIGVLLGVSTETVKTSVSVLRKKLGARNGCHAVSIGVRQGLI